MSRAASGHQGAQDTAGRTLGRDHAQATTQHGCGAHHPCPSWGQPCSKPLSSNLLAPLQGLDSLETSRLNRVTGWWVDPSNLQEPQYQFTPYSWSQWISTCLSLTSHGCWMPGTVQGRVGGGGGGACILGAKYVPASLMTLEVGDSGAPPVASPCGPQCCGEGHAPQGSSSDFT